MNSIIIELQKKWELGQEIQKGGFGRIYEAKGEDGEQVVVKLVSKAPGANRELLFEPLTHLPHVVNVIPIIDRGEWQNSYVLVMPYAEKSLRQYLAEVEGKPVLEETIQILLDVAEALAGVQQEVVHRDLKPENILLYRGRWCLADFGIARYIEATTAPDTRKQSFTLPYAAPEQWRYERATSATDVYAFGIIAFELLQGHRPFPGPAPWDYQEQHLNQLPPSLVGCPPSIGSLVIECLYKAPQARPTAANILERLRKSLKPSSPAAAQLQAVNQMIVSKQAQAGAAASAQKSTEERRKRLFHTAQQSLEAILERFRERILDAAPSATITQSSGLIIQLGDGKLSVETIKEAPARCLEAFDYPPAFDVIAYTAIAVRKPRDRFGYEGRGHSLWFCDAHDEGIYRWYEIAFMIMPLIPQPSSVKPSALSPNDKNAAEAFSPTMAEWQVAWEPLPFDQGDEEQFIERWLGWFAGVASGALHQPSQLPENSGGRHRVQR